jgi:predicted RNase H-like nuclease
LESKHEDAGERERVRCLEAVDGSIQGVYDRFESAHIDDQPAWARRIGSSNRDDLLDAMALALTAKLGAEGFKTLPEEPPEDSKGLPMEIVYTHP